MIMRLRKIAVSIVMIILAVLFIGTFNVSNAATGSKYLAIRLLRESGFGYQALLQKNIWKIVEASDSSGNTVSFDSTIYCLKGGPGFGSDDFGSGTPRVTRYTQYFDMKNPEAIPYDYVNALPDINSNTYRALMWVLDHVYIPAGKTAPTEEKEAAETYKNFLLSEAGIEYNYLTPEDIDVVQQLVIWHYTNTGDSYDVGESQTFELYLNSVEGEELSEFLPLSDGDGEGAENGEYRAEQAIQLYQYFIRNADANATTYDYKQAASAPYQIADTTQTVREQGNNYIIGPFEIESVNNTVATLEGKFVNGQGQELNPTLQNASGVPFNNLAETVGQEFYIVVPNTTNIDEITFTISGTFYNTTIEYWSVANQTQRDQPVAIITRTEEDYTDSTSFKDENFDLALRKFIVSINDVAPTVDREPQISDSELDRLENGDTLTANKVHPKTPLVVKTGDVVVYTIRVYNEGDIDGIVKEITDYLPDGLELKPDSEINTENGWVDNGEGIITTNILDGVVLKAFNGTTLDSRDVQIECVVTASVGNSDTNLKNIAEITDATDSEGNNVPDRDSTPGNVDRPEYGNTSQEDDDDFEDLIILGQYFDLSLRKFIIAVNDTQLTDESGRYLRAPVVDLTPLTSGTGTTAIYNHPKAPVAVSVGDEVIYTIRVYNEGQINGYVHEITDYLPENLEFVNDEFNAQYGWKISGDGRVVTTDITSPNTEYSASRDTIYENRKAGADKVILEAFDGTNLDYIDVQIKCRVKDTAIAGEKLTNITEITDFTNSANEDVTDRDSVEDNVTIPSDETLPNYKDDEINRGDDYIPGQQDDDDFDKVVIKKFDLALRKYITGVNEEIISNRVPVFSIVNGEYVYTHTKDPVEVRTGDIVTYTLRIYNEGDIAGYANEVKDDIPEGLEFLPDNTTNINYRWVMYDAEGNVTEDVSQAVSIRTDYLSKEQEEATGRENLTDVFDPETMNEPDYKELRIAFRVTEPNTSDRVIINTAEISEDCNEAGEPVEDVDSTPDNDEAGEDDIDIDKIKVNYFDLALRKFITGVNNESISNRVPVFSIVDGEYTYTHPKAPIEVANGDVVIYTLRVYNEGFIAGYAEEVKDDVPEGLEFIPNNSINEEYRWVMYDADGNVTEDVSQAETIRTDYLSKEQEAATGRDNLIAAFDPETMTQPDYKDLQIAFRVTEPNTSDRVLINTAEISEDRDEEGEEIEDIDSTPDNDQEEEDDIDIEKVKVSYFDLALKKIITKVTMTLDGETTVEETGHTFEDNPEEVVNVELGNHKINDSVLKFTYQIRITNEGNKAGYAYEIKDYIPQGLEFVEEDNEGWTLSEDGKTVTTDLLADTLLEPGESATVEITLRWINGHNNLGVKTNWAEISEDSDDDIDSTPDNFEKGEDDIDDAEVVLSIVTGVGEHYIGLITVVLVILAGGIVLIKKFVL